jgi:hypothetical protein
MEGFVLLGILGIWGVVHWVRNEKAYQEWARQRDLDDRD